MRGDVTALASGALFGTGLVVSGMSRPSKVLGFLDVTGKWDPDLAFVMMGALVVYGVLSRVITKRKAPLFGAGFEIPKGASIDASLLVGAALFGVGWGIAGFCPGPAIVALGSGALGPIVFVAAMAIGMMVFRTVRARSQSIGAEPSAQRSR